MKHDVTYTVRNLNAVFTDEVETKTGTHEEIEAAVRVLISELLNSEQFVLREIVLVVDK